MHARTKRVRVCVCRHGHKHTAHLVEGPAAPQATKLLFPFTYFSYIRKKEEERKPVELELELLFLF